MLKLEDLYDVAIDSIQQWKGRSLTPEEQELVKVAFHLGLVEKAEQRGESHGKTSTPYGIEWSQ